MRLANTALIAGGLGFAVAALVGCGASGALLTGDQASRLDAQLNTASEALSLGECGQAADAISSFRSTVDGLESVNGTLLSDLDRSGQTIASLLARDCPTSPGTVTQTQTTGTQTRTTTTATTKSTTTATTTTPTTTTATTTTPTNTLTSTTTTPTTTIATNTQTTTTTTTTPTDTTPTSTTGTSTGPATGGSGLGDTTPTVTTGSGSGGGGLNG
jgi:hypothetical protein